VILASSSYPFLEVFWTMLIFFVFVIWIWILIGVVADIFRRHDTSGLAKVLWIVFIVVLPYLGVFAYLLVEHRGMAERTVKRQESAQQQFDQYVQSTVAKGDPTEQIARAKQLLDGGAIDRAEFETLKRRALA